MVNVINFPPQKLPFSKKNKKWRKQVVDWADSKTFFNYNLVRKSVIHKKINYDLLNGKLHMEDLTLILNPENIQASFIPDKIQHFPIMNNKLDVLRGEELNRVFDYRVIITNPNAVTEIENNKKAELFSRLQEMIADTSQTEEDFNQKLEELNEYYTYEWQDFREIRANALLNHYVKEYNMPVMFNQGFIDALTVGEEIYQCDIVGGEPVVQRVNPLKLRAYKSGYSSRIEDADIIIIEDYWSPGKVIDTYYDVLSEKDISRIEEMPDNTGQAYADSMDNIDERYGFVDATLTGIDLGINQYYTDPFNLFSDTPTNSLLPYDLAGNIRVIRVYWKSKRRIKKVKSYDPETGEEVFTFYPESYNLRTDLGEEEEIFYINEAWEGTKIGSDIYVNMRPRPVQYNRISNPSRCHFGIIGSVYSLNDNKPFSLVDKMKPYNYLYDVIHDRLNKLIARNWGRIISLDLAKVPSGWEIDKWLYYAKTNGIAVVDSFKEGDYGAALGKVAGALNNASSGVIDAEAGNSIQQYINLLEFIKLEMSESVGITRQREGQISNRETVGGVERATLQSSHITEWLFSVHDDIKRRVMECFLETAKVALKGRNVKFQYILSDFSTKIIDVNGDEFSENDYGLVVDNSGSSQKLNAEIETLAQAALQTQTLSFSTIMKLYGSSSIAEKQRFVERDERALQERQNQISQQQQQTQERIAQMELNQKAAELEQKEQANIRDNETKLMIANIQAESKSDGTDNEPTEESRANLLEKIRQFDEKLKLDRDRLELDKKKIDADISLKKQALNKKNNSKDVK
jgi:hypothetical protein